MEMKDNLKKYGVGFVERLGGFVKEENKIAKELKLTQDERKAIQTTTFEILGRDAKGWVKRAGIKQNGDSWEYKAI